MIKGKSTVQLFNARSGKLAKQTEQSNIITNAIVNMLSLPQEWVYGSSTSLPTRFATAFGSRMFPIAQNALGGIMCFSKQITENANTVLPPLSNPCVAYAGNVYSGTNSYRGSYNLAESGAITGGYRHVWDFGTDRGNGVINCLALTSVQGGNVGWGNANISAIDDGGTPPDAYNNAIGDLPQFLPNSSTTAYTSVVGPYLYRRVLYQFPVGATGDAEYIALGNRGALYLVKAVNWRNFGLNSVPNSSATDASVALNPATAVPLTTRTRLIESMPVDYNNASQVGLNGYREIYYHNGIVHINADLADNNTYSKSNHVKINRYTTAGVLNDSIEIDFTATAEKPAAENSTSTYYTYSVMRIFIPGVSGTNHDKALYIATRCTQNNTSSWSANNLRYGVWALSADGYDAASHMWAATYLGDLQHADGTAINAYDGYHEKAPSYIPQINAIMWGPEGGNSAVFVACDTPTAQSAVTVPRAIVLPTAKGYDTGYSGNPFCRSFVYHENSVLPLLMSTPLRFGDGSGYTNTINSATGIQKFNNYLGSINNLDSEVEKTTAYTMKITYDITEVT